MSHMRGTKRIASLRQLHAFHAVARLGSVTQAAAELHLSQSAVSVQIGELEASIGAPLVTRTGHGVRLTEAGQVLQGYANRMLKLWTEASDEMTSLVGQFSGILRIGAVTTAEFWLPRLLVTFVNENPRVKIKLRVDKRDEIVSGLTAAEFDIAVMGQPPEELAASASGFAKNPVGFLAAPGHPLMSQPNLTMAALAEARLLVREPGSGTRTTVERLFREAGLRLRIGSELSSNEAIKQMCAAGFGPAYLSLQTCVLEIKAGLLAILPMPNNPFEREWFVVRLASRPVPQVAAAFEHFLRIKGQSEILKQLPALRHLVVRKNLDHTENSRRAHS
jgi:LysR family transcriptional regulator, low CO2-responsive transcriptional regulator